MRRMGWLVTVVALAAVAAPAGAEPGAIYKLARGYMVEAYQSEGSATEVQIFAGAGEVYADSEPPGEEEEEGPYGCVSIFRENQIDEGCGELSIEADPTLQLTLLQGTLESTVYAYDPETVGFEEIGTSTIQVDLQLVASSDPRLAHSEDTGVGLCGLPLPRGGWVTVEIPIQRDAIPVGTLRSSHFGDIDPGILDAHVFTSTLARAGGCV